MKPNAEIWARINNAIKDENAGEVFVTLISGMCALLIAAEVAPDDRTARAHLAAMILSPDSGPVGSLVPRLEAELERLALYRYDPS